MLAMIAENHFVTVELEKLGKKLDRLIEDVRNQGNKIEAIKEAVDRDRVRGRRVAAGVLLVAVAALCWWSLGNRITMDGHNTTSVTTVGSAAKTQSIVPMTPTPASPGQAPPGPAQRGPAQAQQPAPPRPYKAIPMTLPQPANDPSFVAFRKELADIANRKDRATLARLVVANNFFWMGEKGDKADRRKSAIDNLAAAIGLDAGSGWQTLVEAAGEATLEPVPQKSGVMCSPAGPTFDKAAADQVARQTGTEPGDWGFPRKPGVEVRSAPQPNSPVIERLGMHLVRVMPEAPLAGAAAVPFIRVVTPSGKVGYVQDALLSPLDVDLLCYVKDASGWKIAGYAGSD
jgi:hypothetical protein